MAKSRKASKRKISLAAFLRRLWSSPNLMERFSESREGRRAVLSEFNLSARHARLLRDGCVRDIVMELAGAKRALDLNTTTLINSEYGTAAVACGHPECKAFMANVTQRQKKKQSKKKR